MNDRFKFRFWDKETQTMQKIPMVELRHRITLDKIIADNRVIFMQCTGLKDKYGKLIYEGDILKLAEFGKPVEVKHRALGFVLRREPSNTLGYDNDKYIPEDCEVIGNIYENKELLED